MSLFKVEKGRVVLDMDIITNTPQYTALYEADKSEGKELAIAKFRLIFHMTDPRSQYSTAPSSTRFIKIIHDLFPVLLEWEKQGQTGKGQDKQYLSAISYYRISLDLIPERALLTAAQDAVHELADRISNPKKRKKKDSEGKMIEVDDEDLKVDLLGKMAKATRDLNEMKELVKLEEEKVDAIKGKHHIRSREDPEYIHNR